MTSLHYALSLTLLAIAGLCAFLEQFASAGLATIIAVIWFFATLVSDATEEP